MFIDFLLVSDMMVNCCLGNVPLFSLFRSMPPLIHVQGRATGNSRFCTCFGKKIPEIPFSIIVSYDSYYSSRSSAI